MKRWIAALPLLGLLVLSGLFATFGLHHDPHFNPDALVGQVAPDVILPPLVGDQPVHLRRELRPATLINVFASWCAPCVAEQPALVALKAEGVRIIGIAYKDSPVNTRAMLNRTGDPFVQVLVDGPGDAGLAFGVSGVPETFLIGHNGRILAKHAGPLSPEDAERLLERATLDR